MNSRLFIYFKGFHKLALVMTILCGFLALCSTSVKAEVLEKYQSSGENASTYFSGRIRDGLTISGSLIISENMIKSGAGAPDRPGPMGFLTLDIINPETGEIRWGMGEISLSEFDIANSLKNAIAKGTALVEFMNWYDPYLPPPDELIKPYPPTEPPIDPPPVPVDPIIPVVPYPVPTYEFVEFDVTWTGTGDIMTGHNTSNTTYQDLRIHSRSIGRYVDATTAGTIKGETFSLNLEPVIYPDPYYYYYPLSTIAKSKDGYMIISKP